MCWYIILICSLQISDGASEPELLAEGDDVRRDLLDSNDVFVIDLGEHCYVWVGKGIKHSISGEARVPAAPRDFCLTPQKFLTIFFLEHQFFAQLRLFCHHLLKFFRLKNFLPFKMLPPFPNIASILPPGANRPHRPPPLLRHCIQWLNAINFHIVMITTCHVTMVTTCHVTMVTTCHVTMITTCHHGNYMSCRHGNYMSCHHGNYMSCHHGNYMSCHHGYYMSCHHDNYMSPW